MPAKPEWALVLRTALSGIGAVANLSLDTIDDPRTAADVAFDPLTHQPREVTNMTLECELMSSSARTPDRPTRPAVPGVHPGRPEIAQLIIGTLVTNVHMEGDKCGIYRVHVSAHTGKLMNADLIHQTAMEYALTSYDITDKAITAIALAMPLQRFSGRGIETEDLRWWRPWRWCRR